MNVGAFTESIVEETTLAWLEALGNAVLHGPDISAAMLGAERSDPQRCAASYSTRMTPVSAPSR